MAACGATGPEAVPFVWVLSVMIGSLAFVAAFEARGAGDSRGTRNLLQRWVLGAGLWALGNVFGGLVMPDSPAGGGLVFARFGCLPGVVQFLALILIVDLVQTVIHRVLHGLPALWSFHAIHHADARFDTATSLRFHPVETLLRAAADAALVLCLGPMPSVVSAMVIFLTVWNVFDHARVSLSPGLARTLERVFVTPDVHRIHHALEPSMRDRNFGGVFTFWDRLFGWYLGPTDRQFEVGLVRWTAGDDLVENFVAPLRSPDPW